jgi:O-antigen/teichoic acid export membrane protein
MPKLLRRIGQNTGILLLVNGVGSIFGFFMAAALGRGLGDAGFGQYSFVMTWLLSLMLFSEFGLSTVLTRDLAAQLEHTPGYLINSLAGKTVLGLPAILILLLLAPWISPTQNQDVIMALRWGVLFLYSGLVFSSFTAVFKAHQQMLPILWLTLSGQMVLFAGTLALILAQQPLFTIIAWAGLSQSLQCVLAYSLYKKNISTSSADDDISLEMIKFLIVRAWPFALAGFLAALQLRANILLLAYLQGDQALGWYAAANRFVEMGKQLPGAYYVAILPAMAALAGTASPDQRQTLQKMFTQSRLGLLGFGLLAAAGALLLARPVLTLTYGSTFDAATSTLQILTLSLIPAAQNSISIIYLYANGDEKFVNLLTVLGIVLNLSLCFWLIPLWGPAGTAMALLIAEVGLYLPYRARVANRQTQMVHLSPVRLQPN